MLVNLYTQRESLLYLANMQTCGNNVYGGIKLSFSFTNIFSVREHEACVYLYMGEIHLCSTLLFTHLS